MGADVMADTLLNDANALLAAIVESSSDAIVSKDLDGIVTSWNPSAERIFGYTADEMIGRPIATIAAPDRLSEMPMILARIRRGDRIEHYETVRKRKDGRLIDIALTVSPVRDESGRIIGASKIARDVTERRKLEKAVLRQSEELARWNSQLQQVAYATSHDLQEPLRTINSFSQLLRHRYGGRLDSAGDEYIDFITSAAVRMSDLIRDLLVYSDASLRQQNDGSKPVDPNSAVRRALMSLESAIIQSGARIQCDPLPPVLLDEASLAVVFQNLIGNAVKYRSKQVPEIAITGRRDGAFCVFSVEDNGIGIDPEYRDKIFGLFRRLHGADSTSTGVGLALCKEIIERNSGRIWVESRPGGGSIFRFTLPPAGE